MRTLTEINAERQEIIEEGIRAIDKKVDKGRVYTARELSDMSGGLIPADNIQASLNRAYQAVKKPRLCRRYSEYFLFNGIHIKPIRESRTFTYKVYDENGVLVNTFARYRRIIKAEIL